MDLACEFGRYRVRAVGAYTVTVSASRINKSLSLTESCPPFYTQQSAHYMEFHILAPLSNFWNNKWYLCSIVMESRFKLKEQDNIKEFL